MRRYIRYKRRPKKRPPKIEWVPAHDISERVKFLTRILELHWIDPSRLFFMRSQYAQTRAYARIWGLSRIWQMALESDPSYIIEVVSEKFDNLDQHEKDKIILHELAHIPKNFSGALVPHTHGNGSFHDKLEKMIASYKLKK